MTVRELCDSLQLTVFSLPDPNRELTGVYIGDLLSWVMGRVEAGEVWITIMSNPNCIAVATLSDAGVILLAEGVVPDAELIALADNKGVNLVGSADAAYAVAMRLGALGL